MYVTLPSCKVLSALTTSLRTTPPIALRRRYKYKQWSLLPLTAPLFCPYLHSQHFLLPLSYFLIPTTPTRTTSALTFFSGICSRLEELIISKKKPDNTHTHRQRAQGVVGVSAHLAHSSRPALRFMTDFHLSLPVWKFGGVPYFLPYKTHL